MKLLMNRSSKLFLVCRKTGRVKKADILIAAYLLY
jgi:hypothetical protein